MSSHNLVNAIVAGDAIEIENAFNSAMTEKISARLDDYRQEIAQSMFTKESIEIDEALKTYNVQVGHPTGARTVKVQAKSKSHAVEVADKEHKKFGERVNKNSVELAKEEFAEILASEEFAKLDELSKTTLGSYVKKATGGLE